MSGALIDPLKLRKVAGAFPTGVTVVTIKKEDGEIHGMTASSFVSVSLAPALVSFCIKKEAGLFELIKKGEKLGISILNSDQKEISNQFAGISQNDISVNFKETELGTPVIKNALGWYGTTINQIIEVGDHFLIVCLVIELGRTPEGLPLVYWSGYRSVSDKL